MTMARGTLVVVALDLPLKIYVTVGLLIGGYQSSRKPRLRNSALLINHESWASIGIESLSLDDNVMPNAMSDLTMPLIAVSMAFPRQTTALMDTATFNEKHNGLVSILGVIAHK